MDIAYTSAMQMDTTAQMDVVWIYKVQMYAAFFDKKAWLISAALLPAPDQ